MNKSNATLFAILFFSGCGHKLNYIKSGYLTHQPNLWVFPKVTSYDPKKRIKRKLY